jgi:hypothetical protein
MNCKQIFKEVNLPLLALSLAILAIFSFRTAEDPRINKIIKQFNLFASRSNLQKVYIKTDKDKYITGETIWMNAFVLNAASFSPDSSSREVFVDLIDRYNVVREGVIIKNNYGICNGYILLKESLPEGNYQLVAYTNWMKNFDEAYFFSKTVEIVNPAFKKIVTSYDINEIKTSNKDFQSSEKEKVVQFFPEGGNLVNGLDCRIAFKATNKLGYGIDVTGEIYDESGKKIVNIESKHLGMGVFNFVPDNKHRYYAKITFQDGKSEKFDLPAIQTKGYVIMVNANAGDQIRLNIRTNVDTDNDIIIVGQARSEIRYMSKAQYKGKPININIPKKSFPAGIAQITLFNGDGEAVCERLVFVPQKDVENRTKLQVEKQTEGDNLVYKLSLKQANGNPSEGKLSLAINENKVYTNKWSENILSNLLLTSDLKGRVENAFGYFDESNPEANMKLDYVMMVNGWRRFVWKEILADQFQSLLFAPSEGVSEHDINTLALEPLKINLSNKAYPIMLNETFDNKIVRKNTRPHQDLEYMTPANIDIINHKTSSGYTNIIDYLKGKVAGVTVSDNGILIRGIATINGSTEPLILQDYTPILFSDLKNLRPDDVTSVEVLKGPDASLYGVRGANGVVILHMRKPKEYLTVGPEQPLPEKPARFISFQKTREYYVPAYETWTNKPQDFNVPRSVYWNPLITIDSTGVATIKVKNNTEVTDIITSIEGIANDGSVLFYQSAK